MDSKMVLEFDPQNGVQNWHLKEGLNILFFVDLFQVKIYGTLLGATSGCHFWTPFWGSNSGSIFGSIFQPPFWGPKMVQKFAKVFAVKAA